MSGEDQIRLTGIGGYGYHGVLASERKEGQPFHVDLALYTDTSQAARTDDLEHTINYAELAAAVSDVIEGPPVNLIETLAGRIADAALEFEIAKVDVTVHKPQAPVGVPFTDVEVSITRSEPTGASTTDAGPGVHDVAEPSVPPAVAVPAVPTPELLADNEGIPAPKHTGATQVLDTAPSEAVDIVLGLGGNVGNVRETMRRAIEDLMNTSGIEVVDASPLARTAPVSHNDAVAQDDYLNAVVLGKTTLSARQLLEEVHRIEDAHGRIRVERWGDRTLDIDIVMYGDIVASAPDLTVPHPRASQRAFVLLPWSHVDSEAVIPGDDGGLVRDLADHAPDREGVRWLALDWLEDDTTSEEEGPPTQDTPLAAPESESEVTPEPEVAPEPEAAPEPAADPVDSDLPAEPEPSEPQDETLAPPQGWGTPDEGEDLPESLPPFPNHGGAVPPVTPTPPPGGAPSVAEWVAGKPEGEETYEDASPALPPPAAEPPSEPEVAPKPETAEPQEPTPEQKPGPPAVEWLGEDESAPLSARPQWLKVRGDE